MAPKSPNSLKLLPMVVHGNGEEFDAKHIAQAWRCSHRNEAILIRNNDKPEKALGAEFVIVHGKEFATKVVTNIAEFNEGDVQAFVLGFSKPFENNMDELLRLSHISPEEAFSKDLVESHGTMFLKMALKKIYLAMKGLYCEQNNIKAPHSSEAFTREVSATINGIKNPSQRSLLTRFQNPPNIHQIRAEHHMNHYPYAHQYLLPVHQSRHPSPLNPNTDLAPPQEPRRIISDPHRLQSMMPATQRSFSTPSNQAQQAVATPGKDGTNPMAPSYAPDPRHQNNHPPGVYVYNERTPNTSKPLRTIYHDGTNHPQYSAPSVVGQQTPYQAHSPVGRQLPPYRPAHVAPPPSLQGHIYDQEVMQVPQPYPFPPFLNQFTQGQPEFIAGSHFNTNNNYYCTAKNKNTKRKNTIRRDSIKSDHSNYRPNEVSVSRPASKKVDPAQVAAPFPHLKEGYDDSSTLPMELQVKAKFIGSRAQVNTLYIKGIPLDFNEDKLRQVCPRLRNASITLSPFMQKSGEDLYYGFITFTTTDQARDGLSLDGFPLDSDHKLSVSVSQKLWTESPYGNQRNRSGTANSGQYMYNSRQDRSSTISSRRQSFNKPSGNRRFSRTSNNQIIYMDLNGSPYQGATVKDIEGHSTEFLKAEPPVELDRKGTKEVTIATAPLVESPERITSASAPPQLSNFIPIADATSEANPLPSIEESRTEEAKVEEDNNLESNDSVSSKSQTPPPGSSGRSVTYSVASSLEISAVPRVLLPVVPKAHSRGSSVNRENDTSTTAPSVSSIAQMSQTEFIPSAEELIATRSIAADESPEILIKVELLQTEILDPQTMGVVPVVNYESFAQSDVVATTAPLDPYAMVSSSDVKHTPEVSEDTKSDKPFNKAGKPKVQMEQKQESLNPYALAKKIEKEKREQARKDKKKAQKQKARSVSASFNTALVNVKSRTEIDNERTEASEVLKSQESVKAAVEEKKSSEKTINPTVGINTSTVQSLSAADITQSNESVAQNAKDSGKRDKGKTRLNEALSVLKQVLESQPQKDNKDALEKTPAAEANSEANAKSVKSIPTQAAKESRRPPNLPFPQFYQKDPSGEGAQKASIPMVLSQDLTQLVNLQDPNNPGYTRTGFPISNLIIDNSSNVSASVVPKSVTNSTEQNKLKENLSAASPVRIQGLQTTPWVPLNGKRPDRKRLPPSRTPAPPLELEIHPSRLECGPDGKELPSNLPVFNFSAASGTSNPAALAAAMNDQIANMRDTNSPSVAEDAASEAVEKPKKKANKKKKKKAKAKDAEQNTEDGPVLVDRTDSYKNSANTHVSDAPRDSMQENEPLNLGRSRSKTLTDSMKSMFGIGSSAAKDGD